MSSSTIRWLAVSAILASAGMVLVQLASHPLILQLSGGRSAAVAPLGLLCAYVPIVVWATKGGNGRPVAAVRVGTTVGFTFGLLEILHILVENFAGLPPRAETISTGVFMFGLLVLLGVAGFRSVRQSPFGHSGSLAGTWAAVIGMLMVVTFGLSQLFWGLSHLQQRNVGSPDLARSGWSDLEAFTIADTFDAAVKVLLQGPLLGAVFGGVGAVIARVASRPRRS